MRIIITLALLLALDAAAKDKKSRRKASRQDRQEVVAAYDPAPPPQQAQASAAAPAPAASRGPTRIDFDDRLIQGQTNQAGSVYLYDRKQLNIEPMVKKRDSFFGDVLATAQGK
jgi:hypothetical protein